MEKIIVTKYKAKDGKIFEDETSCIAHENMLTQIELGNIIVCNVCKGTGTIDIYGDGRVFSKCSSCEGRKYLTKTTVWK